MMDTDSAYFAISGGCFEDVIKPSLKVEFKQKNNSGWEEKILKNTSYMTAGLLDYLNLNMKETVLFL